MVKSGNLRMCVTVFLAAAVGAAVNGCGTSSNRVLESMAVTPAVADAATSAGKVQFKATGSFSKPPSPDVVTFVAPYSGSWGVSNPAIATISASGLAQCVPGASGTVDVVAEASANAASGSAMTSIGRRATAKLTCP
jgi:hypothetical protein